MAVAPVAPARGLGVLVFREDVRVFVQIPLRYMFDIPRHVIFNFGFQSSSFAPALPYRLLTADAESELQFTKYLSICGNLLRTKILFGGGRLQVNRQPRARMERECPTMCPDWRRCGHGKFGLEEFGRCSDSWPLLDVRRDSPSLRFGTLTSLDCIRDRQRQRRRLRSDGG